jgi:hypothetical protein
LAKVRQPRLFPSKISMSNVRSSVGVSFNAMASHEHDLALQALAEIMLAISRDGHDGSFKRWHRI